MFGLSTAPVRMEQNNPERIRHKQGQLKTPCGVTPPPPQIWSSTFCDLLRKVAFRGLCLTFLLLILFELGRSWQICARTLFVSYKCKENTFARMPLKRVPKTTPNPSGTFDQIAKSRPQIDHTSTTQI